jgi:hypothetical protein
MNNGLDPSQPQSQNPSADTQSLQTDATSAASLSSEQTGFSSEVASQSSLQKTRRFLPWRRIIGIALLVLGLAGAVLLVVFIGKGQQPATTGSNDSSSRIKSQTIALTGLSQKLNDASASVASTLTVNGKLVVDGSLVLQPATQPSGAVAGQIYYDQSNNNLAFYNGTQFLNLLGSTVNTQVITQVTNVFGAGGVAVNVSGTPGSLALFTGSNALGNALITQSGSTVAINSNSGLANAVAIESGAGGSIQIGNSATDHTIQIGSGAGVQNTTVGSQFTSSATKIQGGTGNLDLSTGSGPGVSGSISITTGSSSTTASGNISIDTGSGVIAGQVIESKTFEGGLDNMNAWFGNTIAQSSAQAHSGLYSLAETGNAANWGVIETLPGVSVTAGHQYYFSVWVRAGSTPRSITGSAVWNGGASSVTLTPVTDSATGWTEMTALGVAPGGATSVYFQFQSIGAIGEVHYFDDMTVTDLSSSSAASVITIGSANAKIVTIGNINQIGATSIFGGSGINLNSGAAGITLNGGVLNFTGSAASSLSTTSGALTLSSAASATWGIATASTGIGGNLTLRAGNGGTDAVNDGGDVIIQGGRPNGAGTGGSVIVKPQVDVTDAFQIQNSTGTPLLVADAAGMTITVAGTDTQFASLALSNAHFRVAQTTAPTVGTPVNCGTTPTAVVTAGSTDTAGSLTITTGTGGTSATCDTVITFHRSYGAVPKSILVVGKTDAGSALRQAYVPAATATTFTVSFAVSAAGADNTPYAFNYWIVE